MRKILILSTIPISLDTLLKGQAKYLSEFYEVKLVTSSSYINSRITEFEGVEVKAIDMSRKITPFQDLRSLYKLYKFILNENPDIVYTFTPKAGLLGMMASFLSKVPVRIHNVVGLPLMEANGKMLIFLKCTERLTYFFSTKIFCNSFGLKEYINSNLTSLPITIIGQGSINGVDTKYFKNKYNKEEKLKIRDEYKILKDDFVITFIGRIVKDKGINELVESFINLVKKYPNLKLLLVGDYEEDLDPINKKNKKFIDEFDSIIAVGFKIDIRKFLAITDLFTLPSYREGLPNSLIEAGSFGIPLLATDINGCNEIIENNETGILVKKKDAKSLEEGIEKLIVNKKLYSHVRDNIRDKILKKYDQNYFWKELKNQFDKAI